jgi:ferritin-like metal-binding protein YciE
VFELLGKPARGKKCDAIEGILDEGKEIMEEYEGEPALDAGLLAAAQAVEHYEISRYGTLKSWATKLVLKDAAKLLDQTLAEEKITDDTLTKIAETAINAEGRPKKPVRPIRKDGKKLLANLGDQREISPTHSQLSPRGRPLYRYECR